MKFLVLNPHQDLIETFSFLIRKNGSHDVRSSRKGENFRELIQDGWFPDFAIISARLGGLVVGLDVLCEIRKLSKETIVWITSGSIDSKTQVLGKFCGATGVYDSPTACKQLSRWLDEKFPRNCPELKS